MPSKHGGQGKMAWTEIKKKKSKRIFLILIFEYKTIWTSPLGNRVKQNGPFPIHSYSYVKVLTPV